MISSSPQRQLWQATLEAVNLDKGKAASILNAWLAASCSDNNCHFWNFRFAQELFEIACGENNHNNAATTITVEHDLVTFCLLFTILEQNHNNPTVAHTFLARAIQLAKKQAGSKRRRYMARRRRVNNNKKENEHNDNANHSFSPLPFMAADPNVTAWLSCTLRNG
jgi:hypothetical protein